MRVIETLGKLIPIVGLARNRWHHPQVHCGMNVEIDAPQALSCGAGVSIGNLSRLYIEGGRVDLGRGVLLGRNVHIQLGTGEHISVGSRTRLNDGCRLYGEVTVGQGCAVGQNLYASSGTHTFRSPEPYLPIALQEERFPPRSRPISIGDDCWFGINVVVLPGVTIGRGAVIAANAVVREDVAPYTIVAGIPAKQVGTRLNFVPPAAIEAANPEHAPYFYGGFAQDIVPAKAYACDETFTLALAALEASVIELTIAAKATGRISHGGHTAEFVAGESTVRLARDAKAASPYLSLRREGGECSIIAARLVEASVAMHGTPSQMVVPQRA